MNEKLDEIYAKSQNQREMVRLLMDYGNSDEVIQWARDKERVRLTPQVGCVEHSIVGCPCDR